MRPNKYLELGFIASILFLSIRLVAAQTLKERYFSEQKDLAKIEMICKDQYNRAQYIPLHPYDQNLRYLVTSKGVQGIAWGSSGSAYLSSSGQARCSRGRYDSPVKLGVDYRFVATMKIPRISYSECMASIPSVTHNECRSIFNGTARLEIERCMIDSPGWSGDSSLFGPNQYAVLFPIPAGLYPCLVSYSRDDNDKLVRRDILGVKDIPNRDPRD